MPTDIGGEGIEGFLQMRTHCLRAQGVIPYILAKEHESQTQEYAESAGRGVGFNLIVSVRLFDCYIVYFTYSVISFLVIRLFFITFHIFSQQTV